MPTMSIQTVLFDLGSTLLYERASWSEIFPSANAAMLQALLAAGLNLDRGTFHEKFMTHMNAYFIRREAEQYEYTTHAVLRDLLAEMGYADIAETVSRAAIDAWYAVTQTNWQVEEDALPTLQILQSRGHRLGMISNAGDDKDVQSLVDQAGLRPYFEFVLTSAAVGHRKPHPFIFQRALTHWGIPPTQAVMIGDSLEADIQGANGLGLYSIWITRRAAPQAEQAQTIRPNAAIAALSELPPLLASLPR